MNQLKHHKYFEKTATGYKVNAAFVFNDCVADVIDEDTGKKIGAIRGRVGGGFEVIFYDENEKIDRKNSFYVKPADIWEWATNEINKKSAYENKK